MSLTFQVTVDTGNLGDPNQRPKAPEGSPPITVSRLNPNDFVGKLNSGNVAIYGFICKDVSIPSIEQGAADCDPKYLADDGCVIIYLGGTPYRMCP